MLKLTLVVMMSSLCWLVQALYIPQFPLTIDSTLSSPSSINLPSRLQQSISSRFSLSQLTRFFASKIEHVSTHLVIDDKDDNPPNDKQGEFELWIANQSNISFEGILQNIGGVSTSLDTKEVHFGVVIASPSKKSPDYFYQWTRDSALTIRSLIYWLDDHSFPDDSRLRHIIEGYIEGNYHLQRLTTPSGKFDDPTKKSLGEPKFHPDGTSFEQNWGRPQSDGPGLRVSTIFNYFELLKKYDRTISNKFLQNDEFIYFNIIKHDLVYIINNWDSDSFDLWEEINSRHFFNSLTQLRALKDGITLTTRFEPHNEEFLSQLHETFDKLREFIVKDSGFTQSSLPYLVETPQLLKSGKRSGLDAAVLLGSIHSHNIENTISYEDIPFEVNDNSVLNTIAALVADMKYRYPINHDKIRVNQNIGVGLGRYPEDIYDGYGSSEGNPWFISTASAAEVFYKTVFKLITKEQDVVIDEFNKDFLSTFLSNENDQPQNTEDSITLKFGSTEYYKLLRNLFSYADSFLSIIRDHVDSETGAISEQFNKYHGFMQGANNLTWSYSSFYNSVRWRVKALGVLNESTQ